MEHQCASKDVRVPLVSHPHPDDQATGNRQVGTMHGIDCLIGLSPGSVPTYIWMCQRSLPAAGQPAAEQPLRPEGLRPRVEAGSASSEVGQASVQ